MTTKCAGINCRFPEENHSPECIAEHAASAAGGRFVKGVAMTDNIKSLVERLRIYHDAIAPIPNEPSLATEAADLIEQQAARIAEARSAKPIAYGWRSLDGYVATSSKAGTEGWERIPLYAAPVDSAMAKDAERRHWNPIYNTDPVQRACGELPEGWEIEIGLELGAGWVGLCGPDGAQVPFDDDADKFDWKIHKAIDAALAASEPKNTGE